MSGHALSWTAEVRHSGLNKFRVIRGPDKYVVDQRAAALKAQWDEEWARRSQVERRRNDREQGLASAARQTEAATRSLAQIASILTDGLAKDGRVNWSKLKDRSSFPEPKPSAPSVDVSPPCPTKADGKYEPKIGLLEFFISKRKAVAISVAEELYNSDVAEWEKKVAEIEADNDAKRRHCENLVASWEERKAVHAAAKAVQHESVDQREAAARSGDEAGVVELIDLALAQSSYPDFINVNYDLDYASATKSCVVEYDLPAPFDLPSLREVKFVQTRQEFTEKFLSENDAGKLYDSMIYQIALRTLHTIFAADEYRHIDRVTFNGWVDYVDRGTGMDQRSCILSVGANRSDLDKIDLARVDPRECFRSLKGVAASKLVGLAPVAPLERPRLMDKRFIESRDVASNVDAGLNVAAMDWQDFEHLVRQVFQAEFASNGTEVRVTQASRDGGVDAVIFDPDPIRGGKTLIQAKRYTNTVDVSAVRDLYGTVINEGASKGILVTTSQFGPDARKFAQDKPITLIDGGNFLFLLERIGVNARIDLQEAKLQLAQEAAARSSAAGH